MEATGCGNVLMLRFTSYVLCHWSPGIMWLAYAIPFVCVLVVYRYMSVFSCRKYETLAGWLSEIRMYNKVLPSVGI